MKNSTPRTVLSTAFAILLLATGLIQAPTASGTAGFEVESALASATHLAQAIGERAAGTAGGDEAAIWLSAAFETLGYEVQVQPFSVLRFTVPYTATNVIAVKPGQPGYGTLYVGAHYDTIFRQPGIPLGGPGANDNASGTSVVLEAARVLASEAFSPTIKFIAFSAEEDGLVGSSYFVSHLPLAERLTAVGMINLDCVGIGDKLDLLVHKEADRPFAESLGVQPDFLGRANWGSSDHVPFSDAGIPAAFLNMNRDNSACGPDYHLSTDTVDKLERAAMERTGFALETAVRNAAEQSTLQQLHLLYFPLAAKDHYTLQVAP